MVGLIFLGIGLLCALIGRIMLIGAAFNVSVWWGIGVLLPFGPLFFRLSYPDLCSRSRMFRLATLPCVLLYFWFGPGFSPAAARQWKDHFDPRLSGESKHLDAPDSANATKAQLPTSAILSERIAANAAEFERLRIWSDKLRLQKRDLLHSDLAGTRAYNSELANYKTAVEKANAERNSLLSAR